MALTYFYGSFTYQVDGYTAADIQGVKYFCVLTGAPDSEDDLTIQMASFTALLYSAKQSFGSVVTQYTSALADEVEKRPNGELVITQKLIYSDGTETEGVELFRVNYDEFRYDKGPHKKSMTLSGTKQFTNNEPLVKPVFHLISEKKLATGQRVFVLGMGCLVLPGDTAVINTEEIVIESVRMTVSIAYQTIELKEVLV